MLDYFVFNFFAILTLSIWVALCGKRRTTSRNSKKPPSKSPSQRKSVKPQTNISAKSIKASSKVPKVVGYQPTREDEGMETDTNTKTLSDEKVKPDLDSKPQKSPCCSRQKAIETEQKSANSIKTVSEKKKKSFSDERSSRKKLIFSDSIDESEHDSLRTMKKTAKSSKDEEEKSSNLESIQTEEDDRTKTKSIE